MSRVLRFPFAPSLARHVPAGLSETGATKAAGLALLPIVPLRVYSIDGSGRFIRVPRAFLDTGSYLTVLRRELLKRFDPGPRVRSINHRWGTTDYPCDLHSVTLELCEDSRTPGMTWLWPTIVGFSDAPLPHDCLLGRVGFFQFFNVKFFAEPATVEIEATATFDQGGGRME